ncbi:PREDICTED: sec1 family domain-containing protein 2-like isoform X2 [Branchiostoma belcheri]|uniref:Sec1 family domain-containing protein 2-like isoform X2 n=1 Tax=Branchiostoma belcheri TaxID=7741 RepID=A0A6P5A2V4_BRABE|nr:PREDICTED: sec1 family domain-containing protein 2-like isoform X2 [Branchiostoma belcheri]
MPGKPLQGWFTGVWDRVCAKVNKAVVFLDGPSAEVLHWCGGAARLFKAGAVNVKEFSSFESAKDDQPKAVFVLSSVLKGQAMTVIRDIITASQFQYCVVVCSVNHYTHQTVHGAQESESREVFDQFEEKMCEWMGNMNYTAEVLYEPVSFAPICPGLFTTPAYSSMFPLTPSDMDSIRQMRIARGEAVGDDSMKIDFSHLSTDLQIWIKMLVSNLSSLFEGLNVREDCYAVGPFSRVIASELANLNSAKNRRKTAANKASILFVDRSLDMVGPCGHQTDSLADKVITLLPRLQGHTVDVSINMTSLLSKGAQLYPQLICPGTLSHADSASQALLNSFVTLKQKECLMDVNRHLVEVATQEKLLVSLPTKPGRLGAQQLEGHLKLFREPDSTRAFVQHAGVLQLAMAAVQTLNHPLYPHTEELLGLEKTLMQNAGDQDCPTALHQLTQLLQEREESKDRGGRTRRQRCSLEDVLALLVFVYSLLGEEHVGTAEEEGRLRETIIHAILSQATLSPELQSLVGENTTEDRIRSVINDVFIKLKGLGRARTGLQQFGSVFTPGSVTQVASYRPLVRQLMEQIFHPDKPDVPDVEHLSSGLTDLLKSGFRMFMSVSKPRPSDHPLLMVYVVGGVTCQEVRLIREAVAAAKTETEVVVGSTRLLKPSDVVHQVLCQNNLFPDLGL